MQTELKFPRYSWHHGLLGNVCLQNVLQNDISLQSVLITASTFFHVVAQELGFASNGTVLAIFCPVFQGKKKAHVKIWWYSWTSLILSRFVRFPGANIHDQVHKRRLNTVTLHFYRLIRCRKIQFFGTNIQYIWNCNRAISFSATRSHVNKNGGEASHQKPATAAFSQYSPACVTWK